MRNLRTRHSPVTFEVMHSTSHSARITFIAFALLLLVGDAVAACAWVECGMQPPPADTITAVCCCDSECAGIVADEMVQPTSEVSIGLLGATIARVLLTQPVVPDPLASQFVHPTARSGPSLFQLYQSYRL
jgi:hypothetical protein